MGEFLETVTRRYNTLKAHHLFGDGYDGVTVAGVAIVALDTGNVFLAQRAYDETDDSAVQETWEFPGGHLEDGEDPYVAAMREFIEEIGEPFPEDAYVVTGWRSEDGHYQGFVVTTEVEWSIDGWQGTDEVQDVAWVDPKADDELGLRPEMREFDWTLLDVSGNEDKMPESEQIAAATQVGTAEEYLRVDKEGNEVGTAEVLEEPDLTWADLEVGPIPIHGVLAPEDIETGDGRGFNGGSVTSRPGILPFSWQKSAIGGHDGSIVTGGLTRMMRKDGMIHYEGFLMPGEEAGEFAGLLAFFGRFGVSVDGDKGSIDAAKASSTGVMWFDAVRAAGLTAVAIPAFHEAYVAFGPHPDMPSDATLTASLQAAGDLVTFDRGPGWVTNPKETKRLHDYWTKKGEPGYAKIRWGTPGDFTRAKKLIGAKISANSPEDMKYLNQIIAQWHHDALGYWPGELGKPGNAPDTPENRKRAARHAAASRGIEVAEEGDTWEAVLTSSAAGKAKRPSMDYFVYQGEDAHGALTISEPDEFGFRHTYGYAAEWGVCHIGYDGRCVEAPADTEDFKEFHLGYTRLDDGTTLNTGVITYLVEHRDAETILTETAEQAHFDNVANAWAAVRLGQDDRGIWFSGVVLPNIPEDDLTLIEATGQVSGEWKYSHLRALQCVNTSGFPVLRSSAEVDDEGNIKRLVAVAHDLKGCEPTLVERMAALKAVHESAQAEKIMATLREQWPNKEAI